MPSSRKISKSRKSKVEHPPSAMARKGSIKPLFGRILPFVFSAKKGKARDCTRVVVRAVPRKRPKSIQRWMRFCLIFPKKYELTTLDRVFDKKESGHLRAWVLRPTTQMTQNDSRRAQIPAPPSQIVTSSRWRGKKKGKTAFLLKAKGENKIFRRRRNTAEYFLLDGKRLLPSRPHWP